MSKPKNWPPSQPYLTSPLHDALTPAQLLALRTPPSPSPSPSPSSTPTVPRALTASPSPLVRIQPIQDPSHPAHTQHGLFAARDLAPGAFVLAYLGRVHGPGTADAGSDYDLWLDREAGVAVDAARGGNEARFVNDYRGVRERPNAVFGNAFCERWGEVCVAVWVMGRGGKEKKKKKKKDGDGMKAGVGIRKGEEILVSYGKGFWDERRREGEGEQA
ncbi:hypothetical protein ESCO_006488 [Escovopsis weberi]|uniref:SET domain-containing protein n=1 Tax=Escovopsis weberi TaxID=150374 RepID=A0A0M8MQT0_ESCWE|nr:hypothetical protein ESCO_006488 [Escovopsis weberi]